MNMFLLRNMASNMHSPTPSDKFMIFTTAVLDANGQAVLDLSEYRISPYAKLHYTILGVTGAYPLSSIAGEFGTGNIEITSWQVPISITSVAADGDVPAVTVPAASNEVGVLIIVDPRELNG
jgi:hypothetical protein